VRWLDTPHYAAIERRMVGIAYGADEEFASAHCVLPRTFEPERIPDNADTTFVRQMGELVLGNRPPEMYAFTVTSAIPTADAVRGLYAGLNLPCPPLIAIDPDHGYHLLDWGAPLAASSKAEMLQLAKLTKDIGHIAVVDEWVSKGRTISRAGLMLYACGVSTVTGIRGHWYEKAYVGDVDIPSLSSEHSDFMRTIGHDSAQIIRRQQERAA
jgi:hypothetical protein